MCDACRTGAVGPDRRQDHTPDRTAGQHGDVYGDLCVLKGAGEPGRWRGCGKGYVLCFRWAVGWVGVDAELAQAPYRVLNATGSCKGGLPVGRRMCRMCAQAA